METWDWINKDGLTYYVSSRGTKKKNRVRFSVRDLIEATESDDYGGLQRKYLLNDADVSILKTVLKNGRWTVSAKSTLN